MYTAQHISLKRGNRQVLQQVSLAVKPGVFTAVLGPNGAGKSTLLKIFSNELSQYAGEVKLNGKPLPQYKAQELALVRAVLPQSIHINFPYTAREIVQLGRLPYHEPRQQTEAVAEEIMEALGLQLLADRKYVTLSGGEQQRVQLARVMAQIKNKTLSPRYLLLDEPTSSLDLAQQHSMLQVAKNLCRQNVGVLAILHDLNLAALYADELLLLKDGKPIAQGAVAEVMQEGLLEKTFSHPVQVVCNGCCGRPFVMAMPQQQPKNELIYALKFSNHG
ncbi:heme ABC transporter ATP-binding protein [Pontibacter qinzhouensis]|uniref:Heme ABC transporter ATP-binding protein n=1 Tax=Pontibacter qinzhouensis TaxID=2603253 RepID=A0A5C8KAN4_9BACT|nr:heme ABC transporter ATP-binding protein [Pontibacter qinzhouensis]TXK50501.1 heme ABC transporter ATP-binding protein [Pontibacter qinzhouensis]